MAERTSDPTFKELQTRLDAADEQLRYAWAAVRDLARTEAVGSRPVTFSQSQGAQLRMDVTRLMGSLNTLNHAIGELTE